MLSGIGCGPLSILKILFDLVLKGLIDGLRRLILNFVTRAHVVDLIAAKATPLHIYHFLAGAGVVSDTGHE